MALESISGAASNYPDTTKVVKSTVQTNQDTVAPVGPTETIAPNKVFTGNQDGTTEDSKQQEEKNTRRLKNAITDANNKLKVTRTRCEFKYHEEVNRVAIKVLDKETQEVIREIPPEETLETLEKIWEIAGLVVDERR
jgi:flagellar protein FlaG